MTTDEIKALIQRRRLQVLIHSCIYYVFSESLVTDEQWKQWALELMRLQAEHPDLAGQVVYAAEFQGFDPSTGYHLPIREPDVMNRALHLIRYHDLGGRHAKDT